MARFNEDYPVNVVSAPTPHKRDEMLDHFDSLIRKAIDAAEYGEVARLARCACAYERTLWRAR